MSPLTFTFLLLLAVQVNSKSIKSIKPNDDVLVFTGRLVRVDKLTGKHHSLHKQDIKVLDNNQNHHLRFQFDHGQHPFMDMMISQGSVWSRDSVVVIRSGHNKTSVTQNGDSDCFFHGSVIDPNGAVHINRCGDLTVLIQTPDHRYEIEEHETLEGEEEMSHTKFKVTRRKQEAEDMKYDLERVSLEVDAKQKVDNSEHNQINGPLRRKRQIYSVTIELIAYLDANYVNFLVYELNLDTEIKIQNFIISKWGTVQGVYSDPVKIGANVRIQLKKIMIWWNNPPGYPENSIGIQQRLRWFCQNTPDNEYDQKVLYTKGVADHALGVAYLSDVCHPTRKCLITRSPTQNVRVELHEMGHNIGFPHDPQFGDCGNEKGFMGWTNTYTYLPCYKRALQENLGKKSFKCLFEKNVNITEPLQIQEPAEESTAVQEIVE